jgi:hypothetical protein
MSDISSILAIEQPTRVVCVFSGILYGRQKNEWLVDAHNKHAVLSTIQYLTDTPLKNLVSVELVQP